MSAKIAFPAAPISNIINIYEATNQTPQQSLKT